MNLRISIILLSIAASAAAANHSATVNGHKLTYELRGQGRPILFLHGGGDSAAFSFPSQIDEFAVHHQVIAPEQTGHGHTPDVDGPLSYGQMAEDTAELLRQLKLSQVDVVGWSDGGVVGLMLAARHPSLVRRLVVSGANFSPSGIEPKDLRELEAAPPSEIMDEAERSEYTALTPDGAAHIPVIGGKLKDLWLHHPTPDELSPAILRTIQAQVMVMAGDHDVVPLAHTIELYRSLPNAELFILPGTSHRTFRTRPDWVNPVIRAFLDPESVSKPNHALEPMPTSITPPAAQEPRRP